VGFPIDSTDRAALFSSSDWATEGTYTPNGGAAVSLVGVLIDEQEASLDVEGLAVLDHAYLLTFNRDELANPERNARYVVTGPAGSDWLGKTYLLGDKIEGDEHEVTMRAQEV